MWMDAELASAECPVFQTSSVCTRFGPSQPDSPGSDAPVQSTATMTLEALITA